MHKQVRKKNKKIIKNWSTEKNGLRTLHGRSHKRE